LTAFIENNPLLRKFHIQNVSILVRKKPQFSAISAFSVDYRNAFLKTAINRNNQIISLYCGKLRNFAVLKPQFFVFYGILSEKIAKIRNFTVFYGNNPQNSVFLRKFHGSDRNFPQFF